MCNSNCFALPLFPVHSMNHYIVLMVYQRVATYSLKNTDRDHHSVQLGVVFFIMIRLRFCIFCRKNTEVMVCPSHRRYTFIEEIRWRLFWLPRQFILYRKVHCQVHLTARLLGLGCQIGPVQTAVPLSCPMVSFSASPGGCFRVCPLYSVGRVL